MKDMGQEKNSARATRISSVVLLIIFIALALSLVALVLAANVYAEEPIVAGWLAIIGSAGLILSGYVVLQLKRRVSSMRIEVPPINTTLECKKCGFKNVREFQRGDYIFKEGESCQKCNDKMLITAIYREVKEKEKERPRV
jgi:hypothetical protein